MQIPPLRILLLIGGLLIVIAGCNLLPDTASADETAPDKQNAETDLALTQNAQIAMPVDPRQSLLDAFARQLQQPYSVVTTITSEKEGSTVIHIDVIAPDRYYMKLGEKEYIAIGNQYYVRNEGTWAAFSTGQSSLNVSEMAAVFSKIAVENINEVAVTGPEMLDGKRMMVYSYFNSQSVGETLVSSSNKVWVSIDDRLPYKVQAISKTKNSESEITWVITYNPFITIEAPLLQ
jgi:hypothetical protein